MAHPVSRFLIVINNQQQKSALKTKLQHYKEFMQRAQQKCEFYLLYVVPHVPGYALQSPEILHYAEREMKKGEKALTRIAAELEIPADHLIFAEGQSDLQAWRTAKQLHIDKVFGYSKIFSKIMNYISWLKHRHQHWHKPEKLASH